MLNAAIRDDNETPATDAAYRLVYSLDFKI